MISRKLNSLYDFSCKAIKASIKMPDKHLCKYQNKKFDKIFTCILNSYLQNYIYKYITK